MSIFLSKQNVWTDLVLKIKQDLMFDCRFKSKGWGMSAIFVCVCFWVLMRCDGDRDEAERSEFPEWSHGMWLLCVIGGARTHARMYEHLYTHNATKIAPNLSILKPTKCVWLNAIMPVLCACVYVSYTDYKLWWFLIHHHCSKCVEWLKLNQVRAIWR